MRAHFLLKLMCKIPLFLLLLISIFHNPHYASAARTVRVGVYETKPLAYSDKDGPAHGFFVNMLNKIAEKENWNIQYVPGSWHEGLDRLKGDTIDMVLCIAYTSERDTYMDFPKEYLLLDWGLIFKAKGSKITSLFDLEGKSVSALKGDVYLTGFRELVRQFNVNVKVMEVDQYPEVFKAVESGAVAAGVNGNLYGMLNETGLSLEQTPIIFTPVKLGYAVNEGKNGDLITALDRHIAEMKADKSSIYHRELEGVMGKKASTIAKEVYWILSGVVAALLLAIAFIVLLRRQVKAKTSHLVTEIDERKKAEDALLLLKDRLQDQNEELQVNDEELRSQNDELLMTEEMLRVQIDEYETSQKTLKAREESLRRQNNLFASLLQILPIGVFMVEAPSGTPLIANEAAYKLLGRGILPGASKENLSDVYKAFKAGTRDPYPTEEMPIILGMNGITSHIDDMEVEQPDGTRKHLEIYGAPVTDDKGNIWASLVSFSDITDRKRAEEAIQKRILSLTQPIESVSIAFEDLFSVVDVQRLQDEFAKATGVASIITDPEGTPLTAPSNFTRLCSEIIRATEKGCANCFKSDAALGRYNPDGPNIQTCLSGGLWDAGAGITVGGKHIANWLIGQVRDETQTEEMMAAYAREIGADEVTFVEAYLEVPSMSLTQFEQVAQALYTLASQLSATAYQNIQQARFISERKQTEKELLMTRFMIEHASDALFWITPDALIVDANEAACRSLGYSKAELLKLAVSDVDVNYNADKWPEHFAELRCRGALKFESVQRASNGRLYPVEIVANYIQFDDLEFNCAFVRDISERRLSEEQLLSLSQRLQLATSSAHLGVWDWNVKENTMVWDDRMFELYGITRQSFPNSIDAWMNGLHPEDKEAAIAECQAALNGEKEFDTEFRTLHPDGSVKHLRGKGLVLRGADGNAERMIGINYDITVVKHTEEEKYKLESQLQQAQKMESVGRLAGGVAHDFNNMLAVIMGHAELSLMKIGPDAPLATSLKEIRKTAERSADLTRQLLTFARKQTIAPKVLDLNVTVSGMLKMLQRLIGENLHLTWKPAADLWQTKIDPTQVDQILANLCVNARDAIEDTGRITIETENGVIDFDYCTNHQEAVPGDYVRLSVSDDGAGMDRETLAHIFEPFYTTKGMGKGTGLGLATVYGAVKQNNGFINVYSEPGQGTTFSIYLPRDAASKNWQSDVEWPSAPVPRGQETVLLVEDESAILDITAQMLEKQGYTVLKADTPGKAIELAREHPGEIHLLMTDVIMPEMNGRDLSENVLSIYPEIKQLFMSGYTADVIAHHGVLDGGVHFIQKPFSLPNMAVMVREVLDNK